MKEINAHKLLRRFEISVKIMTINLKSKFVTYFKVWGHHAQVQTWISADLNIVDG